MAKATQSIYRCQVRTAASIRSCESQGCNPGRQVLLNDCHARIAEMEAMCR